MDRNSYIGLGLIFAMLIGYFYINQPSNEQLEVQKRQTDSIQNVKRIEEQKNQIKLLQAQKEKDSLNALIKQDTNALKTVYGGFSSQVVGEEEIFKLENEDLNISFSNKGGIIKQVELKKYKTDSFRTGIRRPVVLFDDSLSSKELIFTVDKKQINSSEFFWKLHHADNGSVVYRLYYGSNYIEHTYTLPSKGYNLEHRIQTSGMSNVLESRTGLTLDWQNDIPLQEREVTEEQKKTTIYFKYPEETADYISETKNEAITLEENTQWVSFKQQFFNSTISTETPFLKGSVIETKEAFRAKNVKNMRFSLILPYETGKEQDIKLKYFFGPNQFKLLKNQEIGLDKIIPLGWGIFGWINRFVIIPVFNFLQNYFSNYGLIILLLTLIIKMALLPLVFKSYKSTAKMRLLKPEMDEIKEKLKDDAQAVQVENLKLYKKAGVNPLGGCLPMLLQMPILVAVFQFVPSAFEFRQQSFLWASDLSIYDSIWYFGKYPVIDYIYGDHVSLFTLLMTVSTLIYTRMNNQITGGMNEQMKYVSYLMPILFLGFFNKYAAALTYYYFLSNIITFTQQWAIKRFVNEDKLKAQIHESKNKKGSDKKSAFQKRLEEMAKAKGVDMKKGNKK
jgi:YidC/Oxa1 family membrane protein insertase